MSTQPKCDCKEMTCKEGCTSNYTHKGFSCEKCETQPKWEKEFDKMTDPEICPYKDIRDADTWLEKKSTKHLFENQCYGEPMFDLSKTKIKHFIKQVEHQTILRCVEEIEKLKVEDKYHDDGDDFGYGAGFHRGGQETLDTAINKLQDLSNNT